MIKNIITLCYILFSVCSFAQGEANTWYFGINAGLDFSNGNPEILLDGELATLEGCATISDQNGRLQFYTDGLTVYNKNHEVMLNGTGLSGDISSSQSAIIIPKPGTSNSYYIFTVDADGDSNGLQYSEVNMSLDGGLGGVTTIKNVQLITPTSEQLVATKKAQEDAYWVVSHKFNSNEFVTFEINSLGVNPNPIISTVGSEIHISNNIGQIKFSHQRDRLAAARTNEVQVYDFDNDTGVLSNPITLLNFNENFYSVEFSPNGNFLYASSFDSGLFSQGGIRQFNLNAGTEEEINLSAVKLVSEENELFGALQLAPDGKIYVARVDDDRLDIIENPDEEGLLSSYISNGVFLEESMSVFGLPTFIHPYFKAEFETCLSNESAHFFSQVIGEYDSLFWDFGDGFTSTEINPIHTYNSSGDFTVSLSVFSGSQTLNVTKIITVSNESTTNIFEIIQCDDEILDGISVFNLNSYKGSLLREVNIETASSQSIISFYEDNLLQNEINGDEYININNPQTVFAKIESLRTNCTSVLEINLTVRDELLNSISIDRCVDFNSNGYAIFDLSLTRRQIVNSETPTNLTVIFYETYDDALLGVNSIPLNYTNTLPYNQTIFAKAENGSICYGIYNIDLNVYETPNILEFEDVFFCLDSISNTMIIDSGIQENLDDFSYNWSTGETTEYIEINSPGVYRVTISLPNRCEIQREINVLPSNAAIIEGVEISDFSKNNIITVNISGNGEYLYALDDINGVYQNANTFQNVTPGTHTVYVKDIKSDCGIVSKEISVIGYPKFFTPNGDDVNDTWQIKGLNSNYRESVIGQIEIYDRYGKLLKVLKSLQDSWDGTFGGVLMQNTDYWFKVILNDGQIISGHFALKSQNN